MLHLNHVAKIFTIALFSLILSISVSVYAQDDADMGSPVHIVIEIDGQAEIEYATGGISSLTVGTLVRPDDVILLGTMDQVIILCSDLQIDQITRSSRPSNCAATISDPIWRWQGLTVIDRQRSTGYENIPYLISPRNTALLSPNPTIRWNAITGAASYNVSIFLQNGTLLWEEQVAGTILPYPERHNYLRALDNAGEQLLYEIIITALDTNDNPISTRIDPGIREPIYVLPPGDDRTEIEADLISLDESRWVQSTNENMLPYSEALYLYSQRLYADALERLSPMVVASGSSASDISASPALYLLIADIFVETNIPVEALANYRRAQEIASELGDIASEARALSGLGSLSSGEEANNYYIEAVELYRQLGENALADELEGRIN